MRVGIDCKFNQFNFKKPEHVRLQQMLNQSVMEVKNFQQEKFNNLQKKVVNKTQLTGKLLNAYELSLIRTDYKINKVLKEIENSEEEIKELSSSSKLKKFLIELAQKNVQSLKNTNLKCKQIEGIMMEKYNKSIEEMNENELKNSQILLKFSHNTGPISKRSLSPGDQFYDRRLYNINRLSELISNTSNEKNQLIKSIEINTDRQEIILRVQSEKIYEFYVMFEARQEKFYLKNPYQRLGSMDIHAVRSFNVHQNLTKLLQDLRQLVENELEDNL